MLWLPLAVLFSPRLVHVLFLSFAARLRLRLRLPFGSLIGTDEVAISLASCDSSFTGSKALLVCKNELLSTVLKVSSLLPVSSLACNDHFFSFKVLTSHLSSEVLFLFFGILLRLGSADSTCFFGHFA